MKISRRDAIGAAVACTLGIAIGRCYLIEEKSSAPQGADGLTAELRQKLSGYSPKLADAVWSLHHNQSTTAAIGEFVANANENVNLDGRLPLALLSDSATVRFRSITIAEQLAILEDGSFKFIDLQSGRAVLLVVSSQDVRISLSNVSGPIAVIEKLSPDVDRFVGHLYDSEWLHIEFFTSGSVSYTNGYNVLLARGAERFPEVVIHEFAHTYNSMFAVNSPVFITEGIPDIIAEIFVGRAAYGTYQSRSQVHLGIKTGAAGRLVLTEGANGYALFHDVRTVLGDESLSRAITRIFRGSVADGLQVLKILKSETSKKSELEEIFVARIADYKPGSA